jgi:hypothetical protein
LMRSDKNLDAWQLAIIATPLPPGKAGPGGYPHHHHCKPNVSGATPNGAFMPGFSASHLRILVSAGVRAS